MARRNWSPSITSGYPWGKVEQARQYAPPELTEAENNPCIGRIFGPRGQLLSVVRPNNDRPPFGFHNG